MTSTPRSTPPDTAPSSVTWRFRLVVCSLVLVALAFAQRPGRLVSDTKFDLVADPAAMLARALHMWDPTGGFGQVQNQAYGYLFPMGPFFWLGDLASVPGWAVQRGWWSLLLVVAFLGVVKLCGALGLGSPTSRIVAGFAYALSPRILTTIGPISIEAWPMALAPWVLVPLVLGASRGSPHRAAALSALAVAAVGGVNAAATSAVLPLGVIWLLTRVPGPRRRALLVWWPVLVGVGTLWWLVPLFLLGSYSPPFLDFIETAAVTTFPTTPFDVLRGTSHWVPYVDASWQAGNDLVSIGYVAINGAVLLALGLVGLSLRSNPHRRVLVLGLLSGLVLVSLGHSGAVHGWFAGPERDALDGALAPLRNVHKFDPVLRLPLVLGLAHVLAAAPAGLRAPAPGRLDWRSRLEDGQRVAHVGLLVLASVAVAGVASPALAGRLAPSRDLEAVPGYWQRAVAWLDEREAADRGTALLVPGSSFATYLWGTPEDEPVQSYGVAGWAVRNAVPLAPPGNIRMLDAVEQRLASGQPSEGLAPFLARAGVGLVVVRNDLVPSDDVPLPVLVHQALEGSPGLVKVADFGPEVGGPVRLESEQGTPLVAEGGWHGSHPAVEVYEVAGAEAAVVGGAPPVVVGGPEDLLGLQDAGLLGDEPTVLAVDADPDAGAGDGRPARVLLTDGMRRREATFARVHDGRSATLEASDDGRRGAPARDYVAEGAAAWETTARLVGARSVTASGSRASADTTGPVRPETLPYAAFDGRPETQWESGPPRGDEPWVEVALEEPLDLDRVTVVTGETATDDPATIVVETEAGSSEAVRAPAGETVVVPLPGGTTSWLRVRAVAPDGPPQELAVAEVRADGLDVDRTLVLPEVPATWGAPEHVLLAAGPAVDACVRVDDDVRCAPGRARPDEGGGVIDRTVQLGTGAHYDVAVQVRPVAGDALTGLMLRDQLVNVTASSTAVADARASGLAAIDGRPGTTWLADADDAEPTLSLNWIGEREVRGIRVSLDRQAAASRPTRVEVTHPGGREVVQLDRDGRADLEPFGASRVTVRVLGKERTYGRVRGGELEALPVGVSELRLTGMGLVPLTLSDTPVDIGCGFGPTLRVGDTLLASSVTASPRQLFDAESLAARTCGPETVPLDAPTTRVVAAPAPAFRPTWVTLSLPGDATVGTARAVAVSEESPVAASVQVEDAGGGVLALRHNANAGWEAELPDGSTADPLVVDGWQQGWRVPAGVTTLDLRYAPDRAYRAALAVGLVLLLGLALAAAVLRRRPPQRLPRAGTRVPPWVVPVAGVLALGLVGGWWGVGCGAVGAAASIAARRWTPAPTVAWAAGLPLVAAGLVYWWRPLGSADGWAGALVLPQLLAAVALGALVVADLDWRGQASRSRSAGRSTAR